MTYPITSTTYKETINHQTKVGKDGPLRAAIYIRVSTTEQALQGYSLDAQKQENEDFCKRMGYQVGKIYADEGISGKKQIIARHFKR